MGRKVNTEWTFLMLLMRANCQAPKVSRAGVPPGMSMGNNERCQTDMADRYYRRRLPHWRTDQATCFVTYSWVWPAEEMAGSDARPTHASISAVITPLKKEKYK
jgi:hypothetical protein